MLLKPLTIVQRRYRKLFDQENEGVVSRAYRGKRTVDEGGHGVVTRMWSELQKLFYVTHDAAFAEPMYRYRCQPKAYGGSWRNLCTWSDPDCGYLNLKVTTQTSACTFLVCYLLPKAVFSDEATFYLRILTLHKPRAFVGLEKTLQMFTSFRHCHSRKYMSNFSLLGRQSTRNPTGQAQKWLWLWLQLTVDMERLSTTTGQARQGVGLGEWEHHLAT